MPGPVTWALVIAGGVAALMLGAGGVLYALALLFERMEDRETRRRVERKLAEDRAEVESDRRALALIGVDLGGGWRA
jgi:hypothetical protein